MLANFDPTRPLATARTLPRVAYIEPAVYAAEQSAVFRRTWQLVGRTEQVAAPGQFVTATIADEPVAVVRGSDGTLRAFANVCRHRAARVLTESAGTCDRLRCRYHGWTYDLAGQLRGVPEWAGVADFDRADHGLPEYAVAEWGLWVFVHLETPTQSLTEALAPLSSRGHELGLADLHWHAQQSYDVACNWKVYVDNYLDGGYHVHTIHPGLSAALDYAQYRTDVFATTNVQISPLMPADNTDPTRQVRSGGQAYYWWVYPNLMLNGYPGILDANLVIPTGPSSCRVVFDFYFAERFNADYRAQSLAVAQQVQLEDMDICADVQRGLHSSSYDTGRFSVRRENGGYHFHQLLGRAVQRRAQ
jgi:choline monooxygenase